MKFELYVQDASTGENMENVRCFLDDQFHEVKQGMTMTADKAEALLVLNCKNYHPHIVHLDHHTDDSVFKVDMLPLSTTLG